MAKKDIPKPSLVAILQISAILDLWGLFQKSNLKGVYVVLDSVLFPRPKVFMGVFSYDWLCLKGRGFLNTVSRMFVRTPRTVYSVNVWI